MCQNSSSSFVHIVSCILRCRTECYELYVDNVALSLQLAVEHGIKFVETSAKNSVNVEEAFFTLARDIKAKMDRKLVRTPPLSLLSFTVSTYVCCTNDYFVNVHWSGMILSLAILCFDLAQLEHHKRTVTEWMNEIRSMRLKVVHVFTKKYQSSLLPETPRQY